MNKTQKRLDHLKKTIAEITADQALELQQNGAIVLDVRSLAEYSTGHIANSIHVGRDYLEIKIEKAIANDQNTLITVCQGGVRSLFAAESLINLDYKNIKSLASGINAWQQELVK